MAKIRAKSEFGETTRGPVLSPRFIVALVLVALGIAWVAYYYVGVRPTDGIGEPTGPGFLGDLGRWNYLIGFGMLMLGLAISAHPSTPLGRGRGVVIGMLGCFLLGLVWICTYYVFSNNISRVPLLDDLGQYNLLVGIAFMAVGFTFATRWE